MLTKNDELMLAACKEIDDAREWINRVGDLDVARHCYPADNATFASNTAAALTFLLSTRADGDSAAMQKTKNQNDGNTFGNFYFGVSSAV